MPKDSRFHRMTSFTGLKLVSYTDIGSGPTLWHLMSACAKYKNITLSDPLPRNRKVQVTVCRTPLRQGLCSNLIYIVNDHTTIRAAFVCLSVCLFVPLLLRGPLTDLRQTWWVYVGGPRNCPWGVLFWKGQQVNGSTGQTSLFRSRRHQAETTPLQKAHIWV